MQYDLIAYFTLNRDLWSEKSHSFTALFQGKPIKIIQNGPFEMGHLKWANLKSFLDDFHTTKILLK